MSDNADRPYPRPGRLTLPEMRIHAPVLYLADALGRWTIAAGLYAVDLFLFALHAIPGWRRRKGLSNPAVRSAIVNQILFTGIDGLPVISLVSVAVGAGLVTELILLIHLVGKEADVVRVLTSVVVLELSCLLTAVVVVARSGSAIAVEIGNMVLNEEIDGLEFLGMDVGDMLITPRVIATTVSQFVLATFSAALTIIVGVATISVLESFAYVAYLSEITTALAVSDIALFMLKNLLFGLIIGSAACYHGLRVSHSRTEVPQEMQRAIVNSLSLIFVLDGLFAFLGR